MSPYFIEDRWFPYESLDDGDLLYCQPDGDWDPVDELDPVEMDPEPWMLSA